MLESYLAFIWKNKRCREGKRQSTCLELLKTVTAPFPEAEVSFAEELLHVHRQRDHDALRFIMTRRRQIQISDFTRLVLRISSLLCS